MNAASLMDFWNKAWPIITTACAICSVIDAVVPQPQAGSHWIPIRKLISFFAVNVGHASCGTQPDFTTWLERIAATEEKK